MNIKQRGKDGLSFHRLEFLRALDTKSRLVARIGLGLGGTIMEQNNALIMTSLRINGHPVDGIDRHQIIGLYKLALTNQKFGLKSNMTDLTLNYQRTSQTT
ncbi:hypothetical protein RIF29_20128 [Crotalaria pallida]|uniref:Uncharacterized protein n=1 Tax=Crotalaria pallida TaxID=3830 RepID=A0AAN9F2D5_CROPI